MNKVIPIESDAPNTCDNCDGCCTGAAHGEVYGHAMYPGQPCYFLKDRRCTIYNMRPQFCRDFKCVWLTKRFPLHPMDSGIMLSIGLHKGMMLLMSYALRDNIEKECEKEVIDWCIKYRINCIGYYDIVVDRESYDIMLKDAMEGNFPRP